MGERTPGVVDETPRKIEREIEHLRTRLDRSLAELDKRRHELTDVKLQLKRHPGVFIGVAATAALMLGGVAFAVVHARREQRIPAKAHRFRIALGRAVDHPERVARGDAPWWEKILASVGTAVAVTLVKKGLDRAWSTARHA